MVETQSFKQLKDFSSMLINDFIGINKIYFFATNTIVALSADANASFYLNHRSSFYTT